MCEICPYCNKEISKCVCKGIDIKAEVENILCNECEHYENNNCEANTDCESDNFCKALFQIPYVINLVKQERERVLGDINKWLDNHNLDNEEIIYFVKKYIATQRKEG